MIMVVCDIDDSDDVYVSDNMNIYVDMDNLYITAKGVLELVVVQSDDSTTDDEKVLVFIKSNQCEVKLNVIRKFKSCNIQCDILKNSSFYGVIFNISSPLISQCDFKFADVFIKSGVVRNCGFDNCIGSISNSVVDAVEFNNCDIAFLSANIHWNSVNFIDCKNIPSIN